MSRSPRSQPWARLVATAGLCALAVLPLSACGVPLQRQAEPLPAEALPTVQAQTTVVPPVELTDVFFVNRRLVPFPRGGLGHATAGRIADFMRWEDRRLDVHA